MIEYATLRIIWWALLGFLLIAFALTDGFDLGVAALLPWVARTDVERRISINSIGPVWEGNQVWFILSGGVLFAAWPYLYAVAFSGFYFAMLLALLTLILRPVGFKYRSKIAHRRWRFTWDWILSVSGVVTALVFGVAVGNVIQGIPFYFDQDLRPYYTGSFIALFNPFALLCGLVSISMIVMHGGLYLSLKTENDLQHRALRSARWAAGIVIILFLLAGVDIVYGVKGYLLTQPMDPGSMSNPLHKQVGEQIGAWVANFMEYPLGWGAPLLGVIGALGVIILPRKLSRFAFMLSGVSIIGIISTVGLSMFPFILPSSTHPEASLLVWDASASALSLSIMLVGVIIFLPIIAIYTAWVYRILRGKITSHYIDSNKNSVY